MSGLFIFNFSEVTNKIMSNATFNVTIERNIPKARNDI